MKLLISLGSKHSTPHAIFYGSKHSTPHAIFYSWLYIL